MAIRTSSARDVDSLLEQLRSPAALERDAAIARLRVMGTRALHRVLGVIADPASSGEVRVAALRVIDAVDDLKVRRAAMNAARDSDPAVASAALQVLRPWITHDADTTVLESVTALVTDQTRLPDVRRAALDALSDLPSHLTEPLVHSVAAQLAAAPPLDDAETTGEWLANHQDASLGVLHDLISQARERGRHEETDPARRAWLAVRSSAHAVLARRNSRIALYDARELFELTDEALPLDLLVSMRAIGDVGCLEALATAWERMAQDQWWRAQVQDAARAIVSREKATGRNAVIKRVRTRWPGFLA